jgi:ComF family protein
MRTSPWTRNAAALGGRLFAGTCYLCRGDSQAILCAQCDADLPPLARPRCPQCALPSSAGKRCGRCLAEPPAFDATTAVFAYAFPADILVQGLKFRGELALAPLLADALHGELAASRPEPVDWLVPVPLHEVRLRQRGYNQSMEIARALAALTGVPVAPDLCIRVRDTAAQLELPWKERRDNVRGAFSCRRELQDKRIALVDDVMTTGSTLNEVAATLRKFGAARVVNWVVVRTPMD